MSHIDISTKCVTSRSHDMFMIFHIEVWVASDCSKIICVAFGLKTASGTIYVEFVVVF